MQREKARREIHNDAKYCFEQNLEVIPHKIVTVQPLTSYPTKRNEQDIPGAASYELMSDDLLWTSSHEHTQLADLQVLTYISSVMTLDEVLLGRYFLCAALQHYSS